MTGTIAEMQMALINKLSRKLFTNKGKERATDQEEY